jgi:hypothetical protein
MFEVLGLIPSTTKIKNKKERIEGGRREKKREKENE